MAVPILGEPPVEERRILDSDGNDVTAERVGVGWRLAISVGVVRTYGLRVGDRVVNGRGKVLLEATRETVHGAQR